MRRSCRRGPASAGGYPQLSAEFILKSNPDYIFAKALTGHA